MTRLAVDDPELVTALVYLDAAQDWAFLADDLDLTEQPIPPDPTDDQLASPQGFAGYQAWICGAESYPEAEVRACYSFAEDGALQGPITPGGIFTALAAGAAEQSPPYEALTVPALAIYAVADVAEDMFPWLTPGSPEQDQADSFLPKAQASFASVRASFSMKAPQAIVVELHGAPHYVFLAKPDEVEDAIRSFLATI
jgi:pimeloyl-ACP methyl ester carboxylesterase